MSGVKFQGHRRLDWGEQSERIIWFEHGRHIIAGIIVDHTDFLLLSIWERPIREAVLNDLAVIIDIFLYWADNAE